MSPIGPPQARLQTQRYDGALSFTGHAGANRVMFQGRIAASLTLPLGRYTLVMTATTTSAGRRSQPKPLTFTIVK
jgi:hypothetical protein